jgi:hypothetical protein
MLAKDLEGSVNVLFRHSLEKLQESSVRKADNPNEIRTGYISNGNLLFEMMMMMMMMIVIIIIIPIY